MLLAVVSAQRVVCGRARRLFSAQYMHAWTVVRVHGGGEAWVVFGARSQASMALRMCREPCSSPGLPSVSVLISSVIDSCASGRIDSDGIGELANEVAEWVVNQCASCHHPAELAGNLKEAERWHAH